MRKCYPKSERIKRQYFTYLEDAKQMNVASIDQIAAAIAQFEATTGHRDFAAFHLEQARKFKRVLADATNPATDKPLAKATIYSRLMAVKAFFVWLAGQPVTGRGLPTRTWNISIHPTTMAASRRQAARGLSHRSNRSTTLSRPCLMNQT
jgi:site-specific recombinase XerD